MSRCGWGVHCGGAALAMSLSLFQYRKVFSVSPNTSEGGREAVGWRERCGDFAPCETGFESASTLWLSCVLGSIP